MLVYRKQGLGYLPITKTGSKTFSALFNSLGWEVTQLDLLPEDCKIFGHFRDPIDRHYKGTAEFLIQSNLTHLIDNTDWQKIWSRSVLDIHSYPITWSLGEKNRSITWIPLGTGFPTNELTVKFLHNHGIAVPEIINVKEKKESVRAELFQKLKNIAEINDKKDTLTYFYDSDIVLWNKIVSHYHKFGSYYDAN